MARIKGFTLEQMLEGRKEKILKRFKKDKAEYPKKKDKGHMNRRNRTALKKSLKEHSLREPCSLLQADS